MELNVEQALREAWGRVAGWIEGLVNSLPNIVAAVLVLLVAWVVARVVRRVVQGSLRRLSEHRDLNRLVSTLVYVAVIALGGFVALGVLNLDRAVVTLLAGVGIVGLALGFAFQDIAQNLMSGVLLMLGSAFRNGDIIETGDYQGIVERISMRATFLRTFQGKQVILPNSDLFKNPVINYSAGGTLRVDVAVGISYDDDLESARRVATEAVQALEPRDRSRDVEVFYEEFGDSSINFQLRFWIIFTRWPDFLSARSEAIIRIKKAFDANGITIPFPIRTLDVEREDLELLARSGGRGEA